MTRSAGCPSSDDLGRFAVGDLSSGALAETADHVEQCPACQSALAKLDDAPDELVTALRQKPDGDAPTHDDVAPELMAVARAARRGAPPGIVRDADGGLRLGKFELLEELGSGSFGQVFRARDAELDRIVAIKILRAGNLAGPDEVDRLLREAKSAAQLKHPGIAALFDIGQTADGAHYLVEEFIAGSTLDARLAVGTLEMRRAAKLTAEVADALEYAHRHGVIHRDIKPSNIMLDDDGAPHLMDFGLAKREGEEEEDETAMTLEGQVLGTPAYMSPEQARGESRHVDARSDVYSLGVVLYELLTGERPFRGNRRMLLLHVLEDDPRPLRQLNDKIPRDLETICLKALAKSPGRRYATAAEFAADLRRWLRGDPILARGVGAGERVVRWCRRNPLAAATLAAVTLGSAIGFWSLSWLSEYIVRSTALEGVKQQAAMLEEVDKYYTTEVVDRLAPLKIQVTHDYRTKPGAIPLPATLNIDLGRRVSARSQGDKGGMEVRLYSDHPFKSRVDGGPRDHFEREVLSALRVHPSEPIDRIEVYEGRTSLRFATARLMGDGCVRCHNQHIESTKKDWKLNEVGGVLEIIRPLDEEIARTRAGLQGTFLLAASISAAVLASIGALLRLRRRVVLKRVGGEPGG